MAKLPQRIAISLIGATALGRLAAGLVFALTLLNGSLLAGDLKVTTWNLEWFPNGSPDDAPRAEQQKRINDAAQVLRTLDPDIILVQEVRDLQAVKNLAEAIKPRTYSVAICSRFQEGGEIGKQQVAILAKVPAQAAWAEPWQSMQGVDPPRGFSFAWYKIKGADLAVYCVHLKSNRGEDSRANIRKREVAAQQMLDHIRSVVAKKMPQARSFIIGGDLNTNIDEFAQETTLSSLEKNGFQNCMQGLARPMRVTHPASGGFPDTTFDYLLAKGATISKPQITRSDASDHLPVTCEITLGATGLQADAATALPSPPPMARPVPPVATPSATPPEIIVTITQPTAITIPYGKIVLARGLRLPLSSRQGQTIHVRYMGGVYAIPLSATDQR